ncbi:MAG: hypothetical protein AVDCRST_MAG72-1467 [uncultured Nocardioidaceae bacterium]|uniref:PH domain-containing protein n=1 Tax=uncultured Nocardioidaceae bacterium TaxID=253824 RepID=A0A6J4M6X0_9ACTN|nr:MAG: hypothetical protein AVDCRST_MAG72-1467 [uncultured Nocardioidaceae bacterium]
MAASRGDRDAAPVERFKPTSGALLGYAGLLAVAFGIGYIALSVHTTTGLQVALGLAFFGVVIWTTQLRSRATVYPATVLLKNALVDCHIPLRLVESVTATSTLNVWAGGRRYVCVGIGRSVKSVVKAKRSTSRPIGASRLQDYAEAANRANLDERATSYEDFVAVRIEELAEQAKKSPGPQGPGEQEQVRRTFAWPEIAALVVTGTAFVASLAL